MGEKILDDTYADVLLNSFPKEFEFKRQMHRTDRSSNFEQIKQTANNFHLDDLFRNRLRLPFLSVERRWPLRQAATNVTTVRLPATSSATAVSLRRRIVSIRGKKKGKKSKGGDPSPKRCSYHTTATHNDPQYHEQKDHQQLAANVELLRSCEQRFANIGSALLAQTPQPEPLSDPPNIQVSSSARWVLPCFRRPRQLQLRRRLLRNQLAKQKLLRFQRFNLDQLLRSHLSGTTAPTKGLSVHLWQPPPPCWWQASALTKRSSR